MGKPGSRETHRNPLTPEPDIHGFGWVLDGELAGMGRPGWPFSDLSSDLATLKETGIGALVSLTEEPLDGRDLEASGLRWLHLPIADMTPPSPSQIESFVRFVDDCLAYGKPVVVHCLAGRGRTGNMIACYLVSRGLNAVDAIAIVRDRRPGSIETPDQAASVMAYARARSATSSPS